MPGQPDEALKSMGTLSARSLGEGVYTHLMEKPGSASTFALWSTMHDSGKLKFWTDRDSHEIFFDLEGFALPSPEMCTITGAFIQESLRIGGKIATLTKDACVLDGDDTCCWKTV
jgi:hypothetical protein